MKPLRLADAIARQFGAAFHDWRQLAELDAVAAQTILDAVHAELLAMTRPASLTQRASGEG